MPGPSTGRVSETTSTAAREENREKGRKIAGPKRRRFEQHLRESHLEGPT